MTERFYTNIAAANQEIRRLRSQMAALKNAINIYRPIAEEHLKEQIHRLHTLQSEGEVDDHDPD